MLTAEQMKAVEAPGSIKIVAGAGCGKTTVLVNRILKLIDNGMKPEDIIAITFTRASARELQDRLGQFGKLVVVGTFHAVILRVLGRMDNWKPCTLSEEAADRRLRDAGVMSGVAVSVRGKLKWKNTSLGKQWKAIAKQRLEGGEKSETQTVFESSLARKGEIDFDGIIAKGVERSERFSAYKHVVVDECQDNDSMQWKFIEELRKHCDVTVVGDAAQAIYEWRGAKPQDFLAFDAPRYELSETFRLPSDVAAIANKSRICEVELKSKKSPCGVQVMRESVEDLVAGLLMEGCEPEEIAILSRYNSRVASIRSQLEYKFRLRKEAIAGEKSDLVRMLTYLVYPDSESARKDAWGCTAIPKIGRWISSKMSLAMTASYVRNWLDEHGRSVEEVLKHVEGNYSERVRLSQLFASETIDYLVIEEAVGGNDVPPLQEGIVVSTIHAAKGLEWPIVIVDGVNSGEWPKKDTDEEWRVFHVAITRVMDRLFVLYDKEPSELIKQLMGR